MNKEVPTINLEGKWFGNTYGTFPSNVYAEFYKNDNGSFLDLRLGSNQTLVFIGKINSLDINNQYTLELELFDKNDTRLNLIFNNLHKDTLSGEWSDNFQNKGIIQLNRYLNPNKSIENQQPSQLLTRDIKFGNLRLYKPDIDKIISKMEEIVKPNGSVIVAEELEKEEKKLVYSQEYKSKKRASTKLYSLSIIAQKYENNITSSLTVNLRRDGESNIYVQSPDNLWADYARLVIKEILEKNHSKAIDFYKKYGLTLNFLVFLFLIVWLPDFSFKQRGIFALSFFVFAVAHFFVHKIFSYSIIEPIKNKPNIKDKYSSFLYILGTVFSGVVSSGFYYLFEWLFGAN